MEAEKKGKAPKKSWTKGLQAEFKKIVWPEQQTLVKQTVAVVVITAIIGVLISAVDSAARLCKIINRETNLLVLDEPTNHLDVDAKDELKKALREYRGSILLICHEPEFYQDVVSQVWDCSKWTTKIL